MRAGPFCGVWRAWRNELEVGRGMALQVRRRRIGAFGWEEVSGLG